MRVKRRKTYSDGLRYAWDLFEQHGISIIPSSGDAILSISIGQGASGEIPSTITFTRPSKAGIVTFLSDAEWQLLKQGTLPEVKGHETDADRNRSHGQGGAG